ncbi:unnamed protein product [Urochloa humidicola]
MRLAAQPSSYIVSSLPWTRRHDGRRQSSLAKAPKSDGRPQARRGSSTADAVSGDGLICQFLSSSLEGTGAELPYKNLQFF